MRASLWHIKMFLLFIYEFILVLARAVLLRSPVFQIRFCLKIQMKEQMLAKYTWLRSDLRNQGGKKNEHTTIVSDTKHLKCPRNGQMSSDLFN